MQQALKNLLWAIVLIVGFSLALDAVGIDLTANFFIKK